MSKFLSAIFNWFINWFLNNIKEVAGAIVIGISVIISCVLVGKSFEGVRHADEVRWQQTQEQLRPVLEANDSKFKVLSSHPIKGRHILIVEGLKDAQRLEIHTRKLAITGDVWTVELDGRNCYNLLERIP